VKPTWGETTYFPHPHPVPLSFVPAALTPSWVFFIYQKVLQISIGNLVWGKRVPIATSSIPGSRGTPGRFKDRQRYGQEPMAPGTELVVKTINTRNL